jgi:hypothetical protein
MNSSGRKLPAVAALPGISFAPGVIQLAAFTGSRFFQSIAEPPSMGGEPRSSGAKVDSGSVQEGSERSEGDFDHCQQAMEDLFHIVEKEAPTHLTLQRAVALAEQAKYCMADGLMPFLPEYFTPMINELQADEVSSSHDSHSLATRITESSLRDVFAVCRLRGSSVRQRTSSATGMTTWVRLSASAAPQRSHRCCRAQRLSQPLRRHPRIPRGSARSHTLGTMRTFYWTLRSAQDCLRTCAHSCSRQRPRLPATPGCCTITRPRAPHRRSTRCCRRRAGTRVRAAASLWG